MSLRFQTHNALKSFFVWRRLLRLWFSSVDTVGSVVVILSRRVSRILSTKRTTHASVCRRLPSSCVSRGIRTSTIGRHLSISLTRASSSSGTAIRWGHTPTVSRTLRSSSICWTHCPWSIRGICWACATHSSRLASGSISRGGPPAHIVVWSRSAASAICARVRRTHLSSGRISIRIAASSAHSRSWSSDGRLTTPVGRLVNRRRTGLGILVLILRASNRTRISGKVCRARSESCIG